MSAQFVPCIERLSEFLTWNLLRTQIMQKIDPILGQSGYESNGLFTDGIGDKKMAEKKQTVLTILIDLYAQVEESNTKLRYIVLSTFRDVVESRRDVGDIVTQMVNKMTSDVPELNSSFYEEIMRISHK